MNDEAGVRFLLDDGKKAANFVYRPSNGTKCEAQNATIGIKFAQRRVILDDWYLIGGTRWTRLLFRLKHPIVYSKRGLRNIWRRIKRIFVKDPPMILCRTWKSKEELLHSYPKEKHGYNQKQKNT